MTQKSNFQLVYDFNQTFDFPIFTQDTNPLETQVKSCQYRCDLIKEEGVVEFGQALHDNDLVEMLDAVCDHLYVLYGACYTFSLNPNIYIKMHANSVTTSNITNLIKTHFLSTKTIFELYESNMSKLCKSIEEAEATVKDYQEKYNNGTSSYDTPYYYELKPGLYVVKNKSTGKALKSINYTPADLKQFL